MKKSRKYVRVTEKILKYYPDWQSIVGSAGVIEEETDTSVRVHILSDGKKHMEIKYTIPKDCIIEIPEKEIVTEVL